MNLKNDQNLSKIKYILQNSFHSITDQAVNDQYLPGLLSNRKTQLTKKTLETILRRNPKQHLDGFGMKYRLGNNTYIIKSKFPIKNPANNKINKYMIKKVNNSLKREIINGADPKLDFFIASIRNNNFQKISPNNWKDCQPLEYKNFLFVHNGGFNKHYGHFRKIIHKYVLNDLKPKKYIKKRILDSKLLFHLIVSIIHKIKLRKPYKKLRLIYKEAINKAIHILHHYSPEKFKISLSFILYDSVNNISIIVRYRTCNKISPALYYYKKNGAYFFSSEPLVQSRRDWRLLKDGDVVIIDNNLLWKYKIKNYLKCYCYKKC